MGAKQSSRMVGWALNASLSLRDVPAHRVVNRNGVLTGKHHFKSENKMQKLLEGEGVLVIEDRVLNFKDHFWNPSIELDI